jgi:hypothetical protein
MSSGSVPKIFIIYQGESYSVRSACEQFGIPINTLKYHVYSKALSYQQAFDELLGQKLNAEEHKFVNPIKRPVKPYEPWSKPK